MDTFIKTLSSVHWMTPGRILPFFNTSNLFEEKKLLSAFAYLILKLIVQVVGSKGKMPISLLWRTLRAWTWSNALPVDLMRAWKVWGKLAISDFSFVVLYHQTSRSGASWGHISSEFAARLDLRPKFWKVWMKSMYKFWRMKSYWRWVM
jgi:hypothetical protein